MENINLEILRAKYFLQLKNKFENKIVNSFNPLIFKGKKPINNTISDIFIKTWLVCYIDENNDILIPNKINNEYLIETLTDYITRDKTLNKTDIEKFINENELDNLCTSLQKKLDLFKTYNISQPKVSVRKKGNIVSFKLKMNYKVNGFIINKFINGISINDKQYDRLKSKANDYVIWVLLFRYKVLNLHNNQLAINEKIFNKIKSIYPIEFECFGSAQNTVCESYCSLFYDVEKYFGSQGNFFTTDLKSGFYEVNPPFITTFINKTFETIFNLMLTNKYFFFITVPVWDNKGREEINDKDNGIDYGDFDIYNKVRVNPYTKFFKLIPKNKFLYCDYSNVKYKNKFIQNTYLIIISNMDLNFNIDL